MRWDIQKKRRPMGWDDSQNLPSHPIPWDIDFLKNVPWDGMGWDGMGRDRPIPRGALIGTERISFVVWTNQLLFLLIHYSEPVEWLFLTRHRETLYVQMHTFREGLSKQYMSRHVLLTLSVGGVQMRSEDSRVSLYARECP